MGVVKGAEKEVKETISQTNTRDLASEVAKGAKDLALQSKANKMAQLAVARAPAAENGVKELNKIDPEGDTKIMNGDVPDEGETGENALDVEKAVEYVGSHWQWSLLVILGAVGAL